MSSPAKSIDLPSASTDQLLSSPLPGASTGGSRKTRRPPTITPKRFSRFFTPRSSSTAHQSPTKNSRSSRQLRDITRDSVNGVATARASSSTKRALFEDLPQLNSSQRSTPRSTPNKRKRTTPPLPDSSPPRSSPCYPSSQGLPPFAYSSDLPSPLASIDECSPFVSPRKQQVSLEPIRRVKLASCESRLLHRSFGGYDFVGRGLRKDSCTSQQYHTRNFYSLPNDTHQFASPALPFCTTSCNTNSLVAFGDEEGTVRLVDSSKDVEDGFNKAHLSFRTHSNAIMDLSFAPDDMRLATASGDQSAMIIDMVTQSPIYEMARHSSSVKQVKFQPGQDRIVATCGRDGNILLWDTRCSDLLPVIVQPSLSGDQNPLSSAPSDGELRPHAKLVKSIPNAHAQRAPLATVQGFENTRALSANSAKAESPGRRGDVSITALSFLPGGREHLLITASEANAVIKLWDIRSHSKPRRGAVLPVSETRQPGSHLQHRQFGINSLTLNGDGSRLYALCRDSTVYAYSTNHLILGQASEFQNSSKRRPKIVTESKKGLGPLYGLRHQRFLATTFYVKSSLCTIKGDRSEMLAVGGSDGCAVLFPTDESVMKLQPPNVADTMPSIAPKISRPKLRRAASGASVSTKLNDDIPIYKTGTALVRGHQKEVTSLTWTADGDLVTVGDDYLARCWREGHQAQDLRQGGEQNGNRWNCGWADPEDPLDEEEC
ncbi:MAG: hypothetical protein M1820_001117 [Bogoriella megaspora]|nr:MAG: hypothetical protein M1820_001117 [Bogoriella megaspora]